MTNARLGLGAAMCSCAALCACSSPPLSPFAKDNPPLVLASAQEAGVKDERARFREIFCAVLEARGQTLPD
jgi:hypothetical protein